MVGCWYRVRGVGIGSSGKCFLHAIFRKFSRILIFANFGIRNSGIYFDNNISENRKIPANYRLILLLIFHLPCNITFSFFSFIFLTSDVQNLDGNA